MEGAHPWTRSLLRALERDGFELTHIRRAGGPAWFVRTTPPRHLQEGFGLAPELLVVAVGGEVQARDIREAQDEVVRSGLRLDGNLVVVADEGHEPLDGRLGRIGGHGQRVAWICKTGDSWPVLPDVLRARLPAFDVYEERDAVRGAQLIGRDVEVADLRTRVTRGDAVGLFGLRKMGKTSVMRAVTDWFDPASGLREPGTSPAARGVGVAVVIDATVILERTVDAAADELIRALARRMQIAGEQMPTSKRRGLLAWKDVGEAMLDRGLPLSVVIDEYDLLFAGESGEGPIREIGKLFRLLRGWSQTRQGQVSLILVGRDPSYLSEPEFDGVTSALSAWCTPAWIGPLEKHNAIDLLRKLGRRIGLKVGHESAELAQQWAGGHPLLHRQFGSTLKQATRQRDPSWGAATDSYLESVTERFLEREAVLEVMREIVALFQKRYPTALDLMMRLGHGKGWGDALADLGGDANEAVKILRNFGLATPDRTLPKAIAAYLRATFPEASRLRRVG